MVIRYGAAQMATTSNLQRDAFRRAIYLVREICEIASAPSLIEDGRNELIRAGVVDAIQQHDDAKLFEWLLDAISFQGISDVVARRYMDVHGRVTHTEVTEALSSLPKCAKLTSWWNFEGCGYRKWADNCNNHSLLRSCPLPKHDLRNANLNQAAYGLALFMRDIADGDFVGWLDGRLEQADRAAKRARGKRLAAAVITPLSHVHALSSKVLSMSLATLLLSGDPSRERWQAAGASMVAIDSLVHNWLTRAGILRSLRASHPYGQRCYAEAGCAAIVEQISRHIDAREFNAEFPKCFPRFVQHAIWRFCSQSGLDECNGNRIDDSARCKRRDCELYASCARVRLKQPSVTPI